VTPPTVEVTSLGDNEPPELQSVSVSVVGATVFLTSTVTDNLSGANFVLHQLSSTTSNQFETCFSTLSAGSSTNGTWTCMFTFSPFAARGEWSVQFDIRDLAGNRRLYRRRASDGFLCYTPQGGGAEVCQNLGDASIVVL
jgi:hypothetical protein